MSSDTPEDRFVATPWGRIFTRRWPGQAALVPILLIHESLGSVGIWRSFPETLAKATGRSVIAYDRLGFGASDARQDSIDRDFILQEARQIVPLLAAAHGMSRAILCGHSVGGGMAVTTAAEHPELAEAVVAISAQAFLEDKTAEGIREGRERFRDPAQVERLARYHGDKARWVIDAWTETWLAPDFADWSLDPQLARVTCPLLAVHGELDEYGSLAHPRRIAGARGQLQVLEGIGHIPHREAEGDLTTVIADFLRPLP